MSSREQNRIGVRGAGDGQMLPSSGADFIKGIRFASCTDIDVPSIRLQSKGLANVERYILLARPLRVYENL